MRVLFHIFILAQSNIALVSSSESVLYIVPSNLPRAFFTDSGVKSHPTSAFSISSASTPEKKSPFIPALVILPCYTEYPTVKVPAEIWNVFSISNFGAAA